MSGKIAYPASLIVISLLLFMFSAAVPVYLVLDGSNCARVVSEFGITDTYCNTPLAPKDVQDIVEGWDNKGQNLKLASENIVNDDGSSDIIDILILVYVIMED